MKNKILCVIVMLVLATILVTLTGCGKKEENNIPVAEEEKKEVKLINEQKNIVYTVKEKEGYKIPKINLSYDNIKEINKEISTFGEEFLAGVTIDGKITAGGKLQYSYYENDNILSLVYEYESPSAAMPDSYKVWNVDKYTGELITNEQILDKKGMQIEEFEEKFIEKCKEKYEELGKDFKETAQTEEMSALYDTQFEKTCSKENNNLNNFMYLGENNEIYMVAKIYSLAAADYYEHIIEVKK